MVNKIVNLNNTLRVNFLGYCTPLKRIHPQNSEVYDTVKH